VDDFALWLAEILAACNLVALLPDGQLDSLVDGLICQLQPNEKFFTLLLHLHLTLFYQ
jgi:hypothetical protein